MSDEKREWLIRKGSYFYRPGRAGYTTRKIEAGRYTKAEAEREARIEPWHMAAFHESEVPDEPAVHDLAARLAKAERELDELRVAIMGGRADPSVTHGQFNEMAKSTEAARRACLARAEAAERALEEAEKVIANERRRATDAEYMAQAYRNMLGDIGMKVADMWRDKGVRRVHFSWSGEAEKLTGEERAKHILEWEYAPSREVDPREIDGASPTVSVEEFVSGMESLPSPPKEG